MKSFFSGLKLGQPATAAPTSSVTPDNAKRSASHGEQQMPDMLGKAEKLLHRLRSSKSHDFPLLNEATRLVQLLEGSVTKMPDNDVKTVWREQVNELQRSLQSATEKMLASDMQPAPPAPTPAPPKVPQGRSKASKQAAQPPEPASGGYEAPIMLASADMFSGLDLPGFVADAPPSAEPVEAPVPQPAAAQEVLDGRRVSSGALPLPADLFTGLQHTPAQQAVAAPVDPFAAQQQSLPHPNPHSAAPSITAAAPTAQTSSSAGSAQAPAAASTAAPAGPAQQQVSTGADGRKRKKTTRRVGYARDEVIEAPPVKSAPVPARPASPAVAAAAIAGPPATTALPPESGHATAMPSLSTAPPVVSVATASAGAPLAATHTTAALLDLVSAAPGTPAAHSAPASDSPVAARSSAKAAQDTRPVSPRHHPSRADTPRANAAAEAQPRGSVQAAAGAAARQFGAAQNAVQSLSALADLLPVAAPNAARQDSSGAALLSPHALVQATKALPIADALISVQARAEAEIADLADSISAAVRDEQAARNKRQKVASEAAGDAGQIRQLEDAEQLAVEQEDFEAAANLSTELDSLRSHMQALDRSIRAAEGECEAAVARRAQLALRQVALWQAAAQATAQLQTAHEKAAADAAQLSDKEAQKLAEAMAASEGHVEELKARITARQDWIDKEQASVDAKIEEATRPVAAERAEAAQVHSALHEEVEQLRRQLQQKEEALTAASDKLAEIDQHMHSMAAKYDKTLARLAEDRKAVTAEEAERDGEEAAVSRSREQASQAEAAAKSQQTKFEEQVAAAKRQSDNMLQKASAIAAAVEAESRVQQVQAGLRDQEEQANAAVKDLEEGLEASRVGVRALANHRAALSNEAASGEAQAAAARRRIPELEADKKTAAAARDFKGAAALSAEAKSLATKADQAMSKAQKLRQQVSEAEEQEKEKLDVIRQQEAALAEAKRQAALAKWRRLQASMQGLTQQVEQAAAAENFNEATALQSELDSANSESAALALEHGFSSQHAQDLLSPTPVTAVAQTNAAAAANADVLPSASKRKSSQGTRSSHSSASSLENHSNPDAHNPILPEQLIGNGHIPASKVQLSRNELSAAALDRQADQEDGNSEDADQDSLLVGDSSSVISASHAATDGSRSVQSSRTVLDKMPEFNMDDAVSFRSVSSSRSASQALHADVRSMKAFSTRDETDKADEADETGSFRSMSSTTSTNYTMPRVRQTVRPLYTIPDEASPDDDDEDAEPSSTAQSEENAADDLPVSAAAQALHQEADALVAMSHHTSDNGESLPESGLEAEPSTVGAGHKRRNPSSSKSVGSLESLSGGLTPVSEAQSSGQDEHGGDDDLLADSLTSPSHAQAVTAQMGQTGQHPLPSESQYGGQAPDELQGSTAQTGALTDRLSSQPSIDPAMLHTPRAMSPPRTPGAPVLPKIDAGPTAVPAELVTLQQADDPAPRSSDNAVVTDSTMFAGLDMM